ncbi:hypothetical protein E2C01_055332 [Portunus trituberculatus]|uniref:Uncharacterized protein n=1 Tax=Portunus trituberculatus TaxID=210409 RepID=A0A5B7GUF7_PORTR|nr:hypothetical protein [Portunus trituberculatus]
MNLVEWRRRRPGRNQLGGRDTEFEMMPTEPRQHERQFITVMRSANGPGTRRPHMASGSLPNIASLTNMKGRAGGVELDKGGAERGRGKGRVVRYDCCGGSMLRDNDSKQ